MMTVIAVSAVFSGAALAQTTDCIENDKGEMVCGVLADALRARQEAETRYQAQIDSGEVEPGEAPPRPKFPSVYGSFGQAAFLRGGYAFAAHGGGTSGSIDGFVISAGYRRALNRELSNRLSVETEAVYFRDSEEASIIGIPFTTTATSYTGIVALRWDGNPAGVVNPYASAGAGPAYYEVEVESLGVSDSDGEVVFGYTGRAGLEVQLAPQVSLEAGYRYLGATRDGTIGFHSGEVGLNYKF